jgi:hypothetical protein
LDEISPAESGPDDISQQDIEAAKRRSRINALALGLVLILATLAPYPWNAYAPMLIVIPAIYAIVNRFRNRSQWNQSPTRTAGKPNGSSEGEPYTITPKDPNDPRRYKPIE